MASEVATILTMTRGSDRGCDGELDHPQALPSWALDLALAIVRRHGYGLANSSTPEGRTDAAAGLALAIARALNDVASTASGHNQLR